MLCKNINTKKKHKQLFAIDYIRGCRVFVNGLAICSENMDSFPRHKATVGILYRWPEHVWQLYEKGCFTFVSSFCVHLKFCPDYFLEILTDSCAKNGKWNI